LNVLSRAKPGAPASSFFVKPKANVFSFKKKKKGKRGDVSAGLQIA
jgi:hypothetical protein